MTPLDNPTTSTQAGKANEVAGIDPTVTTTEFLAAGSRGLFDSERTRVLIGLAVLLVFRVGYLALCPMELIPDEAYYWDWSRRLDWSYYSKPPMIAALIALSTALSGDSEFAVRLPATILGTLGLWGVYELGRRMYGHRVGAWSMLMVAVAPGTTVLCLLMTIDAPFICAWTFATYCLWRMLEPDRVNGAWVIPAILATGAGLLSKQTTLGLYPLVGLFLISTRSQYSKLRSPWIWAWSAGSLAFLVPVVWWNARHDWITVAHTGSHFGITPRSLTQRLISYLEFVVSQSGILSPLIFCLLCVATIALMLTYSNLGNRERFLTCFCGIPLAAITVLSLWQRVQPNWPVALYLTGVVIVAAWKCGEISLSLRLDRLRILVVPAISLGCVMSMAVAVVPFLLPSSRLAGTRFDFTGRLRGWKATGTLIAARLQEIEATGDLLLIAATARAPVSELAYYLPGRPRVYRWNVGEVIDSQHDIWGGPIDGKGRDALIVTEDDAEVPVRLTQAFASIEDLGKVIVPLGSTKSRQFRIWRGACFSDWPRRRTQESLATRALQSQFD